MLVILSTSQCLLLSEIAETQALVNLEDKNEDYTRKNDQLKLTLHFSETKETEGSNVVISFRKVKGTFFKGKTSLFEDPTLSKGPFSTMEISSLKQDLDGQKHWLSIGLRSYSGIALEAFNAPNGKVVHPLVAPSKPIVRVPVILYPPWIESEEPQNTLENNMTCLKRGYFCYNKTGITVAKLCCFGFSIDLLKILERELGFIPEIYLVADGQYGSFDEKTGNWSGVVNELVTGTGRKNAKPIIDSFTRICFELGYGLAAKIYDNVGKSIS